MYGFNDGLTANFGLVAGVLGATGTAQYHAVIVAGVAGLIADALSMGSSGYLAAQSEREVYAHEIAMERDEIALMPEIERDELALIYEAKGMDRESAHRIATQVMADPERMLAEQVQEELGIAESGTSPFREAWITGLATAVGALIPVLPFFFLDGPTAVVVSFAISMLSHWLVGAARSVFTGRSVFRSGHGHVRRRTRRSGRRLLRWRVDRAPALAGPPPLDRSHPHRHAIIATSASRRSRSRSRSPSPPPHSPARPPAPGACRRRSPRTIRSTASPAASSFPAGRLGDDHAAGYGLGGFVEFAVPNQPYALRGEGMFQRFALKSGRTGQGRQPALASARR